jgi:hypothetical protein
VWKRLRAFSTNMSMQWSRKMELALVLSQAWKFHTYMDSNFLAQLGSKFLICIWIIIWEEIFAQSFLIKKKSNLNLVVASRYDLSYQTVQIVKYGKHSVVITRSIWYFNQSMIWCSIGNPDGRWDSNVVSFALSAL